MNIPLWIVLAAIAALAIVSAIAVIWRTRASKCPVCGCEAYYRPVDNTYHCPLCSETWIAE